MRVFVVISTSSPPAVLSAIQRLNHAHYAVKPDVWLVAAETTTRELTEALGIRGGENGAGLVCAISSYGGRLPKEAWEWLGLYEAKSE